VPWSERHFYWVLGGIGLVGLIARLIILIDYLAHNPMAGAPLVDAQVYWDWAARVAGGQLIQNVPFFSAPLYPYLLGLLRAVGGTLTTVYVLQIIADLATAGLLAYAGRLRFGSRVGLLAAALFLLLQEPASFSLRVLTCSLQLLLLAATYLQLIRVQNRPSLGRHIGLGVAMGLLCLSYPPAVLLVVAVVPWLVWQSQRRAADWLRPAVSFGVAAALIAPATLHNYYVSGNLFLIQSVTAVNLRQGNQPNSDGGYTPIPNTSRGREDLFEDVRELYAKQTGKPGSWADIDRYYRNQVIDFWLSDPLRTIRLAARKFYMFLTARNYGDIYAPNPEIRSGLNPCLRLAPLPLPWLIGPALVGLFLLLKRPIRYGPEWMMFAIPLLVVVVHWYTPRYRLPALPVIVLLAAWAIERAWHWPIRWPVAGPVTGLLVAEIALGFVHEAAGFDLADPSSPLFNSAAALHRQGKVEEAIQLWRRALTLKPRDLEARTALGDVLLSLGRTEEAQAEFERALAINPTSKDLAGRVAKLLFAQGRYAQAEQVLTRVVEANPGDGRLLGMLADTRKVQGQVREACELFAQAVELAPDDAQLRSAYGNVLGDLGRWEEARVQYAHVVRIAPNDASAHHRLAIVEAQLEHYNKAVEHFSSALTLQPGNPQFWHDFGVLHIKMRRLDLAADCFKRALAISPSQEMSRELLERVEHELAREQARPKP